MSDKHKMNRELKFRICYTDQSNKKHLIYCDDRYMIGLNGIVYENYGTKEKPLWENVFDAVAFVQQYTGLKDDDGKEIYEGDICEIVYHITHGPHEECKAEVFWDDQIGGFLFDRTHQFNRIELTKCKVIGNIYENSKIKTK